MNRFRVLVAWLAILAGSASAEEALTAEGVVKQVNAVPDGQNLTRIMKMELTDRRGKTREREVISYRKYFDDKKATVMFYLSPSNVKDTAFLTWDYSDSAEEDIQWLYLPALRKVRRISAADRGDNFLGTDFSYDDLKMDGKLNVADYNFSTMPNGDQYDTLIHLEAVPKSEAIIEELGYSRTHLSIDPASWVVVKAKFWDKKGNELKQLEAADIREVDGIWTRHQLIMSNFQTGHKTELTFSEVDYLSELSDDLFTRQSLTRGP